MIIIYSTHLPNQRAIMQIRNCVVIKLAFGAYTYFFVLFIGPYRPISHIILYMNPHPRFKVPAYSYIQLGSH